MSISLESLPPALRAQAMRTMAQEDLLRNAAQRAAAVKLKGEGEPLRFAPSKIVKSKAMNKTEKEFADYMKHLGLPCEWEPITLRLGADLRYTPDFAVSVKHDVSPNFCETTFYEVKGFWRDDARAKIKMAAAKYHQFRFVAVQKNSKKEGGGWKSEFFQP